MILIPIRRLVAMAVILLALTVHARGQFPLEPADTSSPRATFQSLVASVDNAYRAAIAGDRAGAARALRRAVGTIDTTDLPPRFASDLSTEAVVTLKEILDRTPTLAADLIPGAPTDVARWRVPHTEITIERMGDGPRAGEYLFSAETVQRAGEFYDLVRDLPAREGGTPGILDAWRANPGSGLAVEWGRRIPAWAKSVAAGATVWQWIATGIVLVITTLLVAALLGAGRWLTRKRAESGATHRFGLPMIATLTLSTALLFAVQRVLDRVVNLTGDVLISISFVLDLVATALLGWLTMLVVFSLAEVVILVRGLDPRAAAGRLVRLFAGGLSVVLVVAIIVVAAQSFGLPAYSILTGLGVGGIAIGFGAQTLVRDVFSGIFFLADDAFRPGEYIDVGSAKGTVERVSVRSVQLRHHNGPLQTIPFGEISHVNNFSRDWVIMKLTFRVPFETDTEKVRKLINKLGRELMEDPELGKQFLEPLKSQGVMEIDDFGLIMRIKFMTRPGAQFTLRRTVWQKLRDMFSQEGIHFAGREVRVRGEEGIGGQALEVTSDDKRADAA